MAGESLGTRPQTALSYGRSFYFTQHPSYRKQVSPGRSDGSARAAGFYGKSGALRTAKGAVLDAGGVELL
jgi:hypothetical protein